MRRYFHLRARIRYWHRRALRAEQALSDAHLLLDAERNRNLTREDTFVSATVMGTRGMFGMPPRTGPARQPQPPAAPQPSYGGGWDTNLTWADKQEFQMQYIPAVESGQVSLQKAQQDFLSLVAERRIPLNDDPFGSH